VSTFTAPREEPPKPNRRKGTKPLTISAREKRNIFHVAMLRGNLNRATRRMDPTAKSDVWIL
jgi:hypothetical protein